MSSQRAVAAGRGAGDRSGAGPATATAGAQARPERQVARDQRKQPGQGQWRIVWRLLRRNRLAMFGLAGLLAVGLAALLAPWLAPHDPVKIESQHLLEAPSLAHPFGTDDLGRDVLSRVLWGSRDSLRVAILGLVLAIAGGTLAGVASGFVGGVVDTLVQRVMEVFLAFPSILLLLSIVAVLGPGLGTIMIAYGIAGIPLVCRFIRGPVLAIKGRDYVTAARALGASNLRIMIRHILPNIAAPVIVFATAAMGTAIMLTAGLSYIGLGAQPPSPEWGAMLNAGRGYLRDAWWMSVFPGLAIVLVILCANLLGDGLRDALDPRLRS